jgi:hypothetical protein
MAPLNWAFESLLEAVWLLLAVVTAALFFWLRLP